jgi:prevent-host-death family protein
MIRGERRPQAIVIAEDIVPIAEFKAHLSEMVRGLPTRRRPVIVTQNGKPAAVMLSPADFDRLSGHARFMSAVEEGLEDIESGRVLSHEDVGRVLDQRFGALPKMKTKAKKR